MVSGTTAAGDDTTRSTRFRPAVPPVTPSLVWFAAALSAVVVLIANSRGIATGDDGVGYRAIADSLLAGEGYGYFLEDPVTVWPPIWPGLMALVAWVTPLDTLGAAIVLNAATAAGVVVVGTRLLRSIIDDGRLVLAGTAVLALGPATVGLGHVLMTDLAFALVTMTWMLTLIRFRRTGSIPALVGAAALVWVGFGLRYVGLVLIPFGGLWLLVDLRRPVTRRLRDGVLYGLIASLAPIAWMLRNRAIDGTFTGERNPSARGLIDNGFDVAATLGRFLLPGVGNDMTYIWAAVGVVVAGAAGVLAWTVLRVPPDDPDGTPLGPGAVLSRLGHRIGSPLGLVVGFAVGYLVYMLYVRTTTALNQLDLRLLFPAYFPLLVGALALIERLDRPPARFSRLGQLTVRTWVAANVVAGGRRSGARRRQPVLRGQLRVRGVRGCPGQPGARRARGRLPHVLQPPQRPLSRGRVALEPSTPRSRVESGARRARGARADVRRRPGLPGLDRRTTGVRTPLAPGGARTSPGARAHRRGRPGGGVPDVRANLSPGAVAPLHPRQRGAHRQDL